MTGRGGGGTNGVRMTGPAGDDTSADMPDREPSDGTAAAEANAARRLRSATDIACLVIGFERLWPR